MLLAMILTAVELHAASAPLDLPGAYNAAKERWEKAPADAEAAWQVGRACYLWADASSDNSLRVTIAKIGADACRRAIALQPKLAPCYYYLGLNLAQMADAGCPGPLRLVKEMEENWQLAATLDPTFDHAGAHRVLGELYRDAPGVPASIGSKIKSRKHLSKAIELCPDYPANHLYLVESYLKWGDTKTAVSLLDAVEQVLKDARGKYAGDQWEPIWKDWETRWAKIKLKAGNGGRNGKGNGRRSG